MLGDGVLLGAPCGAGWTVEAPPAEPVSARRERRPCSSRTLAVHKLWAEELSAAEWRALRARRFGVGGLALGERVTA